MDFDLKEHTHLLAVSGSRAYGMQLPSSDIDLKGVAIPPKKYALGCMGNFKQADSAEHMQPFLEYFSGQEKAVILSTKLEGSVYSLQKFMKLAADSNPSILDALFCRDEEIRYITPIGEELRENRDIFLSQKAKHTYSGYAVSQLKRIKSHKVWLTDPPKKKPERADFDLFTGIEQDQVNAALAMVEKVVDGWELDLGDLSKSLIVPILQNISLFMAELSITNDDKWKAAARTVGFDENLIEILKKERIYRRAKIDWKSYQSWKKDRNPERAALEAKFGYDLKHASHCVRLLTTCREILESGKLHVWRGDIDAEKLLSIRAGAWKYEELVEWVERESKEQEALYKALKKSEDPIIPSRPNVKKIDELCVRLMEKAYR